MSQNEKKEGFDLSDSFKELREAGWEILKTVGIAGIIVALFNKDLRDPANLKTAKQTVDRHVAKITGEIKFALVGLFFLEVMKWPVMILLGIWRHNVVWGHLHSTDYLSSHKLAEVTVSLMFNEWIMNVAWPLFAVFMGLKLMEKGYVIMTGLNASVVGASVGFFGGLKFAKDQDNTAMIQAAFGNSFGKAGEFFSRVFTKGQNEGAWYTATVFLMVVTPFFEAYPHPSLLMILSALAVCWLWEVNTSLGNNQDIQGRSVLEAVGNTPVPYAVWDREKKQVAIGHKPAPANFQGQARYYMVGVIALSVVISWVGFGVKTSTITANERKAKLVTAAMNKWHKAHGREIDALSAKLTRVASDSTLRNSLDVLNAQMASLQSVDTTAVRDSLTELAATSISTLEAALPGRLSVKARWATPDSLPPRSLERADAFLGNVWNTMKWNSSNGRTFMDYLLWIGIAVAIAIYGAKRKNAWLRMVFWALAVWVFASTSGIPGAMSVIVAIGLMLALFGFFGPKERGQAAAH